jgi:mannonate dehydratase
MTLAEFLPPRPHRVWHLAAQAGVTHAVCKCAPELTGATTGPDDIDVLASVHRTLAANGLHLCALEGDQFDMSRIKLGLPGRDEALARYCRMLANLGAFGIRLLCYNFMAGIGWHRSGASPIRGGALGTHFRLVDVPTSLTDCGVVEPERMWDNFAYFLRAVLPAARAAGVRLALHPDDPPLPRLRGIARIFGNAAAFDRAWKLAPEETNAVTFCQANFKLAGEDLPSLARRWAGRVAYLHVRDVRGSAEDFVEIFHDESEVDQPALFRTYHELGLDVPVRCDHVPTMHGETEDPGHIPGYGTLGRLLAIGYFKGVLQAQRIPYR